MVAWWYSLSVSARACNVCGENYVRALHTPGDAFRFHESGQLSMELLCPPMGDGLRQAVAVSVTTTSLPTHGRWWSPWRRKVKV